MKILSASKMPEVDAYTIKNEPILDIDLMERAALACTNKISSKILISQKICIFCGSGNNGGDGLAIARQLAGQSFEVNVFLTTEKLSKNAKLNLARLHEETSVKISLLAEEKDFPKLKKGNIIIDAILGSGLGRPINGFLQKVIEQINTAKNFVISIDIPSGFFAEDNSSLTFNENLGYYTQAVKADWTLTLELPFLSFFFPDSELNIGEWEIIPIGLDHEFLRKVACNHHYIDAKRLRKGVKKRKKFSHKGTYGHALLIAGTFGRMGAAILSSKACMRSGVGLLTTHIPRYGYEIMQTTIPEAMLNIDRSDILISEIPDLSKYNAIGIGPSIGQKENSRKAICDLLDKSTVPMVIDADALNILSANHEMLEKLPPNCILTPHPLEFERFVGKSKNCYDRFLKQKEFAKMYNTIVVLKGAHTCTCTPEGKAYFNSTGNSGMASAGSGDVLTGIILALLSQSYLPKDAAVLGVYLHGKAGDIALSTQSKESLIASDIIDNLGKAFLSI